MLPVVRRLSLMVVLGGTFGCLRSGPSSHEMRMAPRAPAGLTLVAADTAVRIDTVCARCDAVPTPTELTRVIEGRVADLRARGGDCSRYGEVLESSYRAGQITLRPFMWRIGRQLASGEAKPNGEMTLAREIDPLNVGVRTVDDLLWSMEHEAAHIAFDIASGTDGAEERANRYVRECRA